MMKRALLFSLALPTVALAASATEAEATKPLWEIGVGSGVAWVPDYPASGNNQVTGVALPFVIYRGEFLRADEDGVRGHVAETERFSLDIGVDASFSADSDDNPERRGLPDLDYLLELGPSLEYRLVESGDRTLTLAGQTRAAFAVNLDRFDYTGIAVEPQITYEDKRLGESAVELAVGLSSKWGYDGFNDYFYEVEPRYQTERRPAYRAREGYLQTALSLRLFYPVTTRLSVFAAAQRLFNDGSANRDSPLYVEDFNTAVGAGLAYSLFVSERSAADR